MSKNTGRRAGWRNPVGELRDTETDQNALESLALSIGIESNPKARQIASVDELTADELAGMKAGTHKVISGAMTVGMGASDNAPLRLYVVDLR